MGDCGGLRRMEEIAKLRTVTARLVRGLRTASLEAAARERGENIVND